MAISYNLNQERTDHTPGDRALSCLNSDTESRREQTPDEVRDGASKLIQAYPEDVEKFLKMNWSSLVNFWKLT